MFQVFASRIDGDKSCGDGYELQLISLHGSGTLKLSGILIVFEGAVSKI